MASQSQQPFVLPIALKPSNLRPIAYRILTKKYGLNIQSSALGRLSAYVGRTFGSEWRGPPTIDFLEKVGRMWKDQTRGIFISGDGVDQIIEQITAKDERERKDGKESQQKPFTVFEDSIGDTQSSQPISESQEDMEDDIDWKDYFKVIDINRYDRIRYDTRRKVAELTPDNVVDKFQLPSGDDTVQFQIRKYHLLKDRLLRNEHFERPTFGAMNSITGSFHPELQSQQIIPIKNLLGRHGQRFVLFGLLTLNSVGLWQLQDDTDAIVLVLSQCIFPTNCFITPGNYVVCDGIYSNTGKFYVSSITAPPPEKREKSLDALGNIDFNGIYMKGGSVDPVLKRRLPLIERSYPQHRMVFLGGDIFLNDLKVLEGLKKLFQYLTDEMGETQDFITIVFPGSFVDKALDVTEISSFSHITSSGLYKSSFDSFAAILEKFPKLCESARFILLPGDKDPWASMVTKDANSVWPKMPIPKIFGNRLKRWVKNVNWSANPCHINYLSHDIVIVRDDLGGRLHRNDISYLSNETMDDVKKNETKLDVSDSDSDSDTSNDILSVNELSQNTQLVIDKMLKPALKPEEIEARKTVKTVLDQGDLSPFTLQTRPILVNYWPALSMIPLPNLLVLVDTTNAKFDLIYQNCHVINPGQFLKDGEINFAIYRPSTRKCEFKHLTLK